MTSRRAEAGKPSPTGSTAQRGASGRSARHATFVVERNYDAPPSRVFEAWSTREAKARWFAGPDGWVEQDRGFDFRIGGRERLKGVGPGGKVSLFEARYQDIVPNRRIVYTYEMLFDNAKISVSLATVELDPAGAGTRLTFTEQAVYLDGYDDAASRERGVRALLNNLERALRKPAS